MEIKEINITVIAFGINMEILGQNIHRIVPGISTAYLLLLL
jgi:hypothetical protein